MQEEQEVQQEPVTEVPDYDESSAEETLEDPNSDFDDEWEDDDFDEEDVDSV